ncbi:hypothetical protein E2C01_083181 [Portunus trituberculatus]|uniref:Uncharacterized protein n=1 Tax=Portunus trituberculatus TaxID=210409 RepID=A0A5B7IRT1_PORTR|nr:hypothetical protein [Portunus trituberculatus]
MSGEFGTSRSGNAAANLGQRYLLVHPQRRAWPPAGPVSEQSWVPTPPHPCPCHPIPGPPLQKGTQTAEACGPAQTEAGPGRRERWLYWGRWLDSLGPRISRHTLGLAIRGRLGRRMYRDRHWLGPRAGWRTLGLVIWGRLDSSRHWLGPGAGRHTLGLVIWGRLDSSRHWLGPGPSRHTLGLVLVGRLGRWLGRRARCVPLLLQGSDSHASP